MTTTTWKSDASHTDVQFSAKHMMVTNVRGKFTDVEGTVVLDETDPTASSGSFTVMAASLTTGVEQRDAHLRSGDFFDAEAYPRITFSSTKVEPKGGERFRVSGDLTIRDVTRPVTFDVEYLGVYQGFEGRRVAFHATTKVHREDFGLTWNVTLETGGWLVGKEIRLEIDLALDEVVGAELATGAEADPIEAAEPAAVAA